MIRNEEEIRARIKELEHQYRITNGTGTVVEGAKLAELRWVLHEEYTGVKDA